MGRLETHRNVLCQTRCPENRAPFKRFLKKTDLVPALDYTNYLNPTNPFFSSSIMDEEEEKINCPFFEHAAAFTSNGGFGLTGSLGPQLSALPINFTVTLWAMNRNPDSNSNCVGGGVELLVFEAFGLVKLTFTPVDGIYTWNMRYKGIDLKDTVSGNDFKERSYDNSFVSSGCKTSVWCYLAFSVSVSRPDSELPFEIKFHIYELTVDLSVDPGQIKAQAKIMEGVMVDKRTFKGIDGPEPVFDEFEDTFVSLNF